MPIQDYPTRPYRATALLPWRWTRWSSPTHLPTATTLGLLGHPLHKLIADTCLAITFTEINAREKDIKDHVGKTKARYRNATALRHQIQNYEISKLASTGVFSIFQRWIHHYSNQWNYLRILRFDWKGTDRANEMIFPENSTGSHICEKSTISRAAAKNGHIYREEDDQESLASSDNQQPNYSTVQRNKKLSWVENEAAAAADLGNSNSVDSLTGAENNLTVYFWVGEHW